MNKTALTGAVALATIFSFGCLDEAPEVEEAEQAARGECSPFKICTPSGEETFSKWNEKSELWNKDARAAYLVSYTYEDGTRAALGFRYVDRPTSVRVLGG